VTGAVCDWAGVSREELFGKLRLKNLTIARQVVAWVMRKRTGLSYPELALILNRDHTTLISSCKRIDFLRAKDPALFRITAELVGDTPCLKA
jgi:chromosomal replication initiator protein